MTTSPEAELPMSPGSGEHAHSLSGLQWLLLLSKATGITFGLLLKAAKGLASDQRNGLSFYEYIAYQGVRDYQRGLSAVGIQNLLPSTSKTCKSFARKHSIQSSEIQLPNGAAGLWLGSRDAPRVIAFFHGGGYMSPILSAHISMAFGFAKPSNQDVSVVVLQYSLACEDANHYPGQLQQAVSLLQHLLRVEKLSPSAITLMGDSAGGHLLLGLLLHLRHPNPLVSPLGIKDQLGGAILISPWASLKSSAESMQANQHRDILSTAALDYWAHNFLGDSPLDAWNATLTAPAEWWSDLPVHEILVVYGEDELLRDDISILCDRIKTHHAKTTVFILPTEIHVHMVMNRFLRINAPCQSEKTFVKWFNDHLGL